MKKCRYCGAQLQNSAKFCTSCGREWIYIRAQTSTSQTLHDSRKENVKKKPAKRRTVYTLIIIVILALMAEAVFAYWWFNRPNQEGNEMTANPAEVIAETTESDAYQDASSYCEELIAGGQLFTGYSISGGTVQNG